MYNYVNSLVLGRSIAEQWQEAQLASTPVFTLFTQFRGVVHIVTHPLFTNELYVDFTSLQTEYASYQGTLEDWFTEIGDLSLPLLSELPTNKIGYIEYRDAHQSGYTVKFAKIGLNYPENYPREDLPDLKITRPSYSTDVTLIQNNALVTINGYLHMTDTDGESMFIKDGSRSFGLNGYMSLGMISFLNVGKITKIPITENMILPETEGRPLYERLNLQLAEDIGNRSFLLSVGGYLQLPVDTTCWQINDSTISLCLEHLPYVERYYEMKKYIDISSLEVPIDTGNPDAIDVQAFKSDEMIRKYMQLSQSFIVLVDCPLLTFRKLYVEKMGIPGAFTSIQEPKYPLITGYGKMSDYWKRFEDGYWAVSIQDGVSDNYIMDYRNQDEMIALNNNRLPGRTYDRYHGHLLELSRQI